MSCRHEFYVVGAETGDVFCEDCGEELDPKTMKPYEPEPENE